MKNIEIDSDIKLSDLLNKLKDLGIKKKDFNKVSISAEMDYTECYYEGDSPSVQIFVSY